MRTLIVTPDYPPPPGGIQTLTRNLERGLRAIGDDVKVVHCDPDSGLSPSHFVPRVLIRNLRDVPQWPYFNRVYSETQAAIQEFDPDVVHATHIVCWPALHAANNHNIPSVVSAHALELSSTRLARDALSKSTQVHAVSPFTEELTQKSSDINDINSYVVPPSIDVPEKIPPLISDGPVFTISRLVSRKNINTLIDAWNMIPDDIQRRHGLIIAGDGPEREEIELLSEGNKTISVLGRISDDRKSKLLRRSSIFALTPIQDGFDVEGFGIVYIEAQANGTPVLGSGTGGIPSAVGDAGCLVNEPQNPTIISEKLEKMLVNEGLRERCYLAIRERIEDFSLATVAQQHHKKYNDLQ
ncbi:glycosyltransferase family 4 protein [Halarchaeum sp. P4]|uniref:glycosyltransferase family 4 protein n=1 Tax=Halarchaeum sp. P4 TaxID=3421639 RepID=UPI003EC13F64